MDIREALGQLDSMNDDQWTKDGAPILEVLAGFVGKKVSRQEVVDAAPNFSRSNMDIAGPAPKVDATPTIDATTTTTVAEPDYFEKLKKLVSADPLGELAFARFLQEFPKNGLFDLEKILLEQVGAVDEQVKTANDMKSMLKVSLHQTRSRIKSELPDVSNQQAIRAYLDSQANLRHAKAEAKREILKGIDLSELDPRAAIDRAFARKTKRGTQRPVM
jgi:hypothetical protein